MADETEFTDESEFPDFSFCVEDPLQNELLVEHRKWLSEIRHEKPNPRTPYKVAVYIRYYNQTKYDNYLDYRKKQFEATIGQYPNWDFVGFYIDEGASAPNMETAHNWSRLLRDCDAGKVDLIITQKISDVSKKMHEAIFCARILAARTPPVGIYFISEDIFTLATYYQETLRDTQFFPSPDWKILPPDSMDRFDGVGGLLND